SPYQRFALGLSSAAAVLSARRQFECSARHHFRSRVVTLQGKSRMASSNTSPGEGAFKTLKPPG
ncbi:hypothetical protein INR49_022794, partial [Caranx melampygus]